MKRWLTFLLTLCLLVCPLLTVQAADLSNIRSETYVVIDAASGQVLLERGMNNRMYPASITKILTCALALERGKPEDTHTMTYEATHSIDRGSTHIALTEEEVVTVRDLLHATMIESANDAANGLAEYVGGTLAGFPPIMNQKAAEVGAVNSNFLNGSGLHEAEHYTTAYDMALITRWALGVPGFRELFGAVEYTIPATNKQKQPRKFGTHHHMMVNSKYTYEGVVGGKLGWTPEARHTLVTLAQRDGLELICVVMRSQSQYEKYEDTALLLDAAFAEYSSAVFPVEPYLSGGIPVIEGSQQVGELVITTKELSFARPGTLAKSDIKVELVAPAQYQKGELAALSVVPMLRFTDRAGTRLAELPLAWEYRELAVAVPVAQPNAEASFALPLPFWQIALVALGVVFVLLLLIRQNNLRKRRKRRRERAARLAAQIVDVAPELRRRPEHGIIPHAKPPSSQQRIRQRPPRYPQNRG